MKKAYQYENAQIGNFLVLTGYYLKELNCKLPVTMNLLQQTPYDPIFGDFFGMLSGKYFIIEFKPNEKSLKDELNKPQRQRLINKVSNPEDLVQFSASCHFICYCKIQDDDVKFILNSYITLTNKIKNIESYERRIIGVKNFLLELKEKGNIGAKYENIKMYIEFLYNCADKKNPESMSGLILNFDEDLNIKLHYFDDLAHLNKEIQQQKVIQKTQIKEKDQDRERGFEMGF